MPEMSKKDDIKIVVPSFAKILIPLGLPDQINEWEECQLPQTDPISEEGGSYRHVRVQQKRKSHLSDSVGGHNLRLKRMRLEVERADTAKVRLARNIEQPSSSTHRQRCDNCLLIRGMLNDVSGLCRWSTEQRTSGG